MVKKERLNAIMRSYHALLGDVSKVEGWYSIEDSGGWDTVHRTQARSGMYCLIIGRPDPEPHPRFCSKYNYEFGDDS